ncbi:MAG: tRNA pseudouridine(55) synthase TruB [Anaerolineae bacterium]|nr:tRNA pseudouridine(55) synthase TruB [Anaerolineae bacterium]
MNGILNLDKPRRLTSHDVVNRVRQVARQRRVGHAGTLDPLATGVLVVCLGQATRLVEYLVDSPKQYRARVRLGQETDTYDVEGVVVAERPVAVDRAELEDALSSFHGPILQVPPMYSAVRHRGRRLYDLARQGIEVPRQPRPVEIERLTLQDWAPPEFTLEVTCSPGTYIRSLAHDLGRQLGCGAHLVSLVRLASGDFHLQDALPLDSLTPARLPSQLLPMDAALQRYPALELDEQEARAVQSGQAVSAAAAAADGAVARAYGPAGGLLAVMVYQADRGAWQPRKVLAQEAR